MAWYIITWIIAGLIAAIALYKHDRPKTFDGLISCFFMFTLGYVGFIIIVELVIEDCILKKKLWRKE